jgi:hypothetical protein
LPKTQLELLILAIDFGFLIALILVFSVTRPLLAFLAVTQ